jgi:Acetyltransferase (GNAT) domain
VFRGTVEVVSAEGRDLGDGLTLRGACLDDSAQLVEFNAMMHADTDVRGSALAEWTRDLFDLPHPTFRAERDVTVVEDTASGRIVSALFVIPQVWSYAGVPIRVGQPELIATHPDYRRRGLVRAQFDVIHQRSRADGQLWQFISGIPWYYRQFGYTYALDLPPRPIVWLGDTAPPARPEFSLRAATTGDVRDLAEIELDNTSRTTLAPIRGTEGFALELARRPDGLVASEILIVQSSTPTSATIGYVAHPRQLVNGIVSIHAFELRRGTSWVDPTAAVLSHLHHRVRRHPDGPGRGIRLALPDGHPMMRCATTRLGSGPAGSYGLYVRVPDIADVLRAIVAVLETRLAASPAVGWTGDLRIELFDGVLQLRFERGRLIAVDRAAPLTDRSEAHADASIPRDTFLQLLLGNRTIMELERTVPDCLLKTDVGALLLDVLFPAMSLSRWEFC